VDRGRPGDGGAYDIVTPTEREARRRDLAVRQRRYVAVAVPCLVLLLLAAVVPAPLPLRLAALAVAAVLPPVAAVRGSGGLRRGGWRR
jgi:hypothetical protein